MIITLKSLAKEADETAKHSAADGPLGRKAAVTQDWGYSKVGMWGVLLCSAAVAVTGLAICIVSAARDRTGLIYGGLLILMIGTYLMLAAVKEKANLELIATHFKTLSAESKDEMIQMLVKGNAGASKDILGLIEKLMNVVFKKGKL
jgi:hypothetical protein